MKQSVCRWLAVPLLALALTTPSWAAKTIEGKVISVADGDTLTLVDANREKVKVRLGQIDAPESAMPYGGKAKQALADKVFGKQVSIAVETKDRYGRVVGVVWLQGKEINLQLLEEGMAWWYKDYSSDKRYQAAQEQARQAKKGLWEQANPQAPWEWRKQQRSGQFVPNSSAKQILLFHHWSKPHQQPTGLPIVVKHAAAKCAIVLKPRPYYSNVVCLR